MGKDKRLRKARMAKRRQARAIRSYAYHWREAKHVASSRRLMVLKLRTMGLSASVWRYGPDSRRGRNPKVLAKRRRQRERLAFVSVWGDWNVIDRKMWIAGLPPEPGRLEKLDAMVQQRAERLHAIAELKP